MLENSHQIYLGRMRSGGRKRDHGARSVGMWRHLLLRRQSDRESQVFLPADAGNRRTTSGCRRAAALTQIPNAEIGGAALNPVATSVATKGAVPW